jgi:hypothetical protein
MRKISSNLYYNAQKSVLTYITMRKISSNLLTVTQREEIAQIAQAEIAKVKMMNKVTAKLEALAVKERERKKVSWFRV